MNVVEIQNLSKRYGEVVALRDLSLSVPTGSIFGFLGPNGSGKSTTLRILIGLLRASDGRAHVFGQDAWTHSTEIRARVGYLPGDARLYDGMTGVAYLRFVDRMRGGGTAAESVRLCERFDLDAKRKIRGYSRGMRQKLAIIQALVHKPELLVLDEPTTGLDPLMQQALHDELRCVSKEGRTVLFSSHTLSEVEQLCDQVAIVRNGIIVEAGATESLRKRALRRVVFTHRGGLPVSLSFPEGMSVRARFDGTIEGTWTGPVDPLLTWLSQMQLEDVSISQPSLEDLFATYYREHAESPS
ncbi:MAG: ABC transporter ATP-binding protein [Planctomycetes bacterium]|nr:ABC transporter ATP-binding protein [Planctomycetota bacterium]